MTPHISGTSLDAQHRYATGAHDIIKRYFAGEAQEPANLIVENGEVCPILSRQTLTKH
jgi:formate dehydrogenase